MSEHRIVLLVLPRDLTPGSLEAALDIAAARRASLLQLLVMEDQALVRLSERERPAYGREVMRWSGRDRPMDPGRLRRQREVLHAAFVHAVKQAAASRSVAWSLELRHGDVGALLTTIRESADLVLLDRRLRRQAPEPSRLDPSGTLLIVDFIPARPAP